MKKELVSMVRAFDDAREELQKVKDIQRKRQGALEQAESNVRVYTTLLRSSEKEIVEATEQMEARASDLRNELESMLNSLPSDAIAEILENISVS